MPITIIELTNCVTYTLSLTISTPSRYAAQSNSCNAYVTNSFHDQFKTKLRGLPNQHLRPYHDLH